MTKTLSLILALCLLPFAAHADLIKQGSTYNRTVLMTSASDHITGATGLTSFTVTLSKAGGTVATITPTVTEIGSGRYSVSLVTANTGTLGALDMTITASGADPSDTHDQVVAFDPQDASLLGLTGVGTLAAQTSLQASVAALPTAASFWSYSTRTLTAQADTPGTATLLTRLGTPTGASIDADILTRLASSAYTAPSAAPTAIAIRQEMDANSTQFASLVTGQGTITTAIAAKPSLSQIQALLPPNFGVFAIDSTGHVSVLSSGGTTLASGEYVNIAGAVLAANLFSNYTLQTALRDVWAGTAGGSTATYPDATHQATHYTQPDGTTPQYGTTLTTNTAGKPVARTHNSN